MRSAGARRTRWKRTVLLGMVGFSWLKAKASWISDDRAGRESTIRHRPGESPARPVPQRLDKQGERGRGLASARVIQVVAGKERAPVVEHLPQPLRLDVRC